MPAPIILFVYNRVDYTRKTLEALANNELSHDSTLYIFSDGPKSNASAAERDKVQKVRDLIRLKSWCGHVEIIEREKNLGLAQNITDGVTSILKSHDKVIVLEDDILTSPGFLRFMNDALVLYSGDESVMHVSGYMFPVNDSLPSTFFYNTASCWGWGTWARAWKHFNTDADKLVKSFHSSKSIWRFNVDGSYPFFDHLSQNASGQIRTWAVKWYASMFLRGGYALHCFPSLVNNIGNEGVGESGGLTSVFTWQKLASQIEVRKIPVIENKVARKAMRRFNQRLMNPRPFTKTKILIAKAAREVLPPALYRLAKRLKTSDQKQKAIGELRSMPRYQEGFSNILGKPLMFADSASFLFIYDEIFSKNIYKFHSTNESPVIIDGGANIGLSLIYFKSLYPDAKVIAFEPDEKVFRALSHNVSSFGLHDVTLVQKALWNEETTLKFYAEGADGGRIANKSDSEKIKHVPTARLRAYLKGKVDFLKLDVEGAELNVLSDCEDLLINVERMFVEYHSFSNMDQELDKLLSILKRAGFRYNIQHIGVHSSHPFLKINEYEGMDLQLNIYAYRI